MFNKAHNDAYIFIKKTDVRDVKTTKFLNKIRNERSYQKFNDKYELFYKIRSSLGDFLNKNLKNYRAFDSEIIPNSSCSDVDIESVELFFDVLEYDPLLTIKKEKGLTQVLSTINAGEFINGEFKLNNSGALFFAKDVSKFDIPHEVKMVRFFDHDGVKTFEKTFVHSSILKILKEAEIFFYKTTTNISEVKNFKRETLNEYPFTAIREALINALVHRDYTIKTASITFYIFPDRIEVKSPGRLVYPLKISELDNFKPIHRNEKLARIFSKTIYMEHVGTGIRRMRDEMRKFGLDEPEFSESGEFFKVVFRNNINNNLNHRQRLFLKANIGEITAQEYMNMFDISRNTATKDLNQLINQKYLVKKKNGRTVFYKLQL